ncbi:MULTISPECIES: glycosyltransferase family 2 protein [Microtetraspora]|uniref:Glycosyltransferase n=1 Tax=Microtetraspora glauca TaxID=1996 RepID=A0ABV3GG12_MICGL|nr:glycosyltransferase family 2 protein [Microtetraspora sp. AC03309]MCC5578600.1 glycosyltransferase [Microtetraspora sp. AC03309]
MSDHNWPSVAAVITTRGDRADFLREAIESIVAQDYPGRINVMVVFDRAEPDESLTELGDGPMREVRVMLSDRPPGSSASRNAGILATESDLVGFCDDDDSWLPGKLRSQVTALRSRPRALFASCGAITTYDGWSAECMWSKPQIAHADLLVSRVKEANTDSFLAYRSALLGPIGLFSEEIPGGFAEDYEMLLRAARHSPIVYAHEVGVRVRGHGRTSHFTGNWETIASANEWLLDAYPEFRSERRGFARIAGQISLAWGMLGRRGTAMRWAVRAFLASPLEIRSYVVTALAMRAVSRSWVQRRLDAIGATS